MGFKMRGDFAGPPTANSPGGVLPVKLPADLVRSLKSLAAACSATLFVVVLTAWKVFPPSGQLVHLLVRMRSCWHVKLMHARVDVPS